MIPDCVASPPCRSASLGRQPSTQTGPVTTYRDQPTLPKPLQTQVTPSGSKRRNLVVERMKSFNRWIGLDGSLGKPQLSLSGFTRLRITEISPNSVVDSYAVCCRSRLQSNHRKDEDPNSHAQRTNACMRTPSGRGRWGGINNGEVVRLGLRLLSSLAPLGNKGRTKQLAGKSACGVRGGDLAPREVLIGHR